MQARDDFFQCVADAGVTFSLDTPIPSQCRRLRQEFERSCKPSWVKHFDVSHDKELKVLQTLRQNINKAATTSTGNLSGQDQRPN